jgi:hypothetical protein
MSLVARTLRRIEKIGLLTMNYYAGASRRDNIRAMGVQIILKILKPD